MTRDLTKPLKVVIAGSREIRDPSLLMTAIHDAGFVIGEVISGGARGVDRLAESWASTKGIPLRIFEADWERYGKAAGPIRNLKMADYADALIAIWDGKSRGTKNMIETAEKQGIPVHVHLCGEMVPERSR
ncbi:MAG: DUF2493 domain-containing protein [Bdellovibrionales bacterium]|nr:DUF2493 domain-containing protein [Bdellovibrionales bacterium]